VAVEYHSHHETAPTKNEAIARLQSAVLMRY
jgi:hypothetical protein